MSEETAGAAMLEARKRDVKNCTIIDGSTGMAWTVGWEAGSAYQQARAERAEAALAEARLLISTCARWIRHGGPFPSVDAMDTWLDQPDHRPAGRGVTRWEE